MVAWSSVGALHGTALGSVATSECVLRICQDCSVDNKALPGPFSLSRTGKTPPAAFGDWNPCVFTVVYVQAKGNTVLSVQLNPPRKYSANNKAAFPHQLYHLDEASRTIFGTWHNHHTSLAGTLVAVGTKQQTLSR